MPAPTKCPRCGGRLLRIAYGMPDGELDRRASLGKVVLGGCCIFGDGTDPTHQCAGCDERYLKRGRELSPDPHRDPDRGA